jgi:16S rRNA (cytosine1402-N4)-methyltransferase
MMQKKCAILLTTTTRIISHQKNKNTDPTKMLPSSTISRYRSSSPSSSALFAKTFTSSPSSLKLPLTRRHRLRRNVTHHRRRHRTTTVTFSSSSSSSSQRQNIEDAHHGHVSVLLDEVLRAFEPVKMKTHVDGTLGAGGHASKILERHREEVETFVGFDVDETAIEIARPRVEKSLGIVDNSNGGGGGGGSSARVHFVRNNFDQLLAALREVGVDGADSILLDLGVSSMHLDRAERGFSFQHDGPLDMRMSGGNESASSSSSLTAFDVVNGWSEEDLGRIFRDYGGERHWKLLAKRVCERRLEKPIETTLELVKALGNPPGKREKIHPATRAFQAVRIATNDELGVIERVIPQAIEVLNPGGRLAIITFHSLEDAIVKKQFRKFAGVPESREPTVGRSAVMFLSPEDVANGDEKNGAGAPPPKIVKMINRKPISASEEEIKINARSRSAKLRVVEKL